MATELAAEQETQHHVLRTELCCYSISPGCQDGVMHSKLNPELRCYLYGNSSGSQASKPKAA
jgi:hypothetical protein